MTEISKYIVNFDGCSVEKIVEEWKWLIGDNLTIILISCIGDLFLIDTDEKIYWLNTGEGKVEFIAKNRTEFNDKLNEKTLVNELFMCDLVERIFESGILLAQNQLLSYKKLPIIGGEYIVENFYKLTIEEHFSITGEIHRQLSNLPNGTKVKVKFT